MGCYGHGSPKANGRGRMTQLTTEMITLVQLTDMEKQVMKKLVDEGFWYNWGGGEATFSDVSPDELIHHTGIEGRKLRGVLASLVKKRMIDVQDMSDMCRPNFKIIYPTYFCYVAYEANNEIVKDVFGVESW